jgi:Protein of unknown function (DUF1566)
MPVPALLQRASRVSAFSTAAGTLPFHLGLAALVLFGSACRAELPDGVFACRESRDCPNSQRCYDGLCLVNAPNGMMGSPTMTQDAAMPTPSEEISGEAGNSGGPSQDVVGTAGMPSAGAGNAENAAGAAGVEATAGAAGVEPGKPCGCMTDDACCDGCQPKNEAGACTSDDLACTRDFCRSGACIHLHDGASQTCLISGRCVAQGELNPYRECWLCDVEQAADDWSPQKPGAMCDDSKFCNGFDSCGAGADLGSCSVHSGDPCVVEGTCNACSETMAACSFATGPTWLDQRTNLTWTVQQPVRSVTWQAAANVCATLKLCAGSTWRLPTIGELRSALKGCPNNETGGACGVTDSCLATSCDNGSCQPCSTDTSSGEPTFRVGQLAGYVWEWSSSGVSDDPERAWIAMFNTGDLAIITKDSTAPAVRCVKRGP